MRAVTERYWVVTAQYHAHPQDSTRHASVDDADRYAEELLARGAVRVIVEPFHRRIK